VRLLIAFHVLKAYSLQNMKLAWSS
jgi:hypothetical protein